MKELLRDPHFPIGSSFWIVPNEAARERLLSWAESRGTPLGPDQTYIAPMYGALVEDPELLGLADRRRPRHIVIGIGAGPQEKLGWFLRENGHYRPAIYCIGGALGFVTGDQVAIPAWADKLYLGWFLRVCANPRVFVPRLLRALSLPRLILKYGERLPPMGKEK